MPKVSGFKVRIEAFVPIDKKDFGKQAAAFAMIDAIQKTKQLPAGFFDSPTIIIDIDAKQGSAEPPVTASGDSDKGPADTPLTTEPIPDGAAVIEAATMLDMTILQTLKLADGTEAMRRISADQDTAERKANKMIPKPKPVAA